MVLHGTLPQVLAGACTVQPEHEGVLLLAALGGGGSKGPRGDACHGDAGEGQRGGCRGAQPTWSSSSTTTRVSLLFLKSILVIFGLVREKAF